MNLNEIILMLGAIVSLMLISRNILNIIFGLKNYNIHKKRLRQLEFKKNKEVDLKEAINITTKPFIGFIIPKFSKDFVKNIDNNLKLIKWNKVFTAEQFIVFYMRKIIYR